MQAPPELIGIHINLASAVPTEIFSALPSHRPPPGLSADENYAFERLDYLFTHGLPPFQEMGGRPQTLYAIEDSPSDLRPGSSTTTRAAWISSRAPLTATSKA